MNVLSLFDGISVARQALENLGVTPENYIAIEIDKFPRTVSENNFPDIIHLDNVEDFRVEDLGGMQIDLLIGGSPCQGFSLQGLQKGLEDPRSALVQHYIRILREVKPKYFLLENVRMGKDVRDYISNEVQAQASEINSKLFVPQSRNRLYWTNIPFEQPEQQPYDVQDYCRPGYLPGYTKKGPPRHVVFTEIFGCLTATYYKGIRADGRPLLALEEGNFDGIRDKIEQLTPEECEALQGLPLGYTAGISNTQRYKALGNAFTCPVIEHILKNLAKNG